jgi:CelD/BcsL family acetyltransferase involved in cellulose biosynthesis
MNLDIEILSSSAAYRSLRTEWNALVAENPTSLLGQDGTTTYEWFQTILGGFANAGEHRVIVARSGAELVGLLPVIISRNRPLGPHLMVATELYGGRNDPLLKGPKTETCAALLAGLDLACPGWASLQATLLAGSGNAQVVISVATRNGYSGSRGPAIESPFFPLLDSAELFKSGISKSDLQKLRASRNKFEKIGSLHFREYVHEHEASKLLEIVLDIERRSWKHEAGTAITTQPRQEAFYRALFPLAMKNSLLHAEVLLLNDEPIAYNFGLLYRQVFLCLKHSNVQAYDKLSPSYLVNESLFEKLRKKGVITFDWMGLTEPHKLRWSDHNGYYRRNTWIFFNRSLKGRLAAFSHQQKRRLAQLGARLKPSE